MDVIDIWQQWGRGRGRGPAMALWGNLVSVYKHKEAVTLKKNGSWAQELQKRHFNLQLPVDMKTWQIISREEKLRVNVMSYLQLYIF